MGEVVSIVYSPKDGRKQPKDHYTRLPLNDAMLVAGYGIDGDRKGGSPHRQLNIMAAETLDGLQTEGFKTNPGEMGEQIVISGLPLDSMEAGEKLQIGDSALVEIIKPRTGCDRFEHIQGHSPQEAVGRLGMIARVLRDGRIRVGDRVQVITEERMV